MFNFDYAIGILWVMRSMILVSLSAILFGCNNYLNIRQPTNDIEIIKKQTVDIMGRLDIKLRRRSVKNEDSLLIVVDDSLDKFNSSFYFEKVSLRLNNGIPDTVTRFYLNPKIKLSPALDSVFFEKMDTSRKIFIKAVGNVIHEVVHYLQASYISNEEYIAPKSMLDTSIAKKYIMQSSEFEAYSVQSYFILYFIDKKQLTSILESKIPKKEKFKLMINAYLRQFFPSRHFTL